MLVITINHNNFNSFSFIFPFKIITFSFNSFIIIYFTIFILISHNFIHLYFSFKIISFSFNSFIFNLFHIPISISHNFIPFFIYLINTNTKHIHNNTIKVAILCIFFNLLFVLFRQDNAGKRKIKKYK